MRAAVLAGGVGAARLLSGMVKVVPPADVTAIVNTGDDMVLHGLAISPDIDTVTYTVAGAIDPERGWGLRDESWHAMEALARYGGATWFRLGDRDLATHLYRTQRLSEGAGLAAVTAEIAAAWGLELRVLPVTEQPLRTMITLAGNRAGTGEEVPFQDYFVRRQHAVPVAAVRFAGADQARPAPGVLDALAAADVVVVAPSNPIVSIAPVLAVPGVLEAVEARRDDAVAVSPLVGGRALKGPADRMLRELGHEDSVVGIARLYAPFVGTLVVDTLDAEDADAVRAAGLRCIVTDTIMRDPAAAAALCEVTLGR
ncbi:MAG TPA: 2-phospho-L-lactate transferase [Acidimicrobiales bacterium]|jgi:LPPG:FO 2-phospho-L-lactate transferase|nr:2-phospho-L-lactate transferase [Acidimicrobiales bacterium]